VAPARRYLVQQIETDLKRKMVFVAGPRQVGKTTMARGVAGGDGGYLNWDVPEDRERILRRELPPSTLWVFDEIHKHKSWRNYLKGLYDAKPRTQRILVTGSARLDLYRRGGDSLQGRYHLLRLHPLTAAEVGIETPAELAEMLELGGFPEPFYGGSAVEARRWSREYRNLVVREEMSSLESISDLGNVELLAMRLPELVGSPLSLNALREDLRVAHKTVERWVAALERLYALFRVLPFGAPRVRAIKKAPKHYHFDWTLPTEAPQRFENLVAVHLLKWVHWLQDTEGRDVELRYFRDTDGREVDFVVAERRKVLLAVECKHGDAEVDKSLRYLVARATPEQAWQISAVGKKDYITPEGIRVAPALALLRDLV
jgi:uncharacterized protein